MSKESLQNCWNGNKDGAGLAFSDNGQLMIFKELQSFDTFWKVYSEAYDKHGEQTDFLLHFRISTGGGVTTDNVHPFAVGEMLMAHNGTFHGKYPPTATQSDTNLLCERMTKEGVTSEMVKNKFYQELLSDHIGSSNKLVFLHPDGTSTIINPNAYRAEYDAEGNWYSNDSYKGKKKYAGNKEVSSSSGYGTKDYGQRGNGWGWDDDSQELVRKTVNTKKTVNPLTIAAAIKDEEERIAKRCECLVEMQDKDWSKPYPQLRFAKYNQKTGVFSPVQPDTHSKKRNSELVYDNAQMKYITTLAAKAIIEEYYQIAMKEQAEEEQARQQAEADLQSEGLISGNGGAVYNLADYVCETCENGLTHDEVENGEGKCLNCLIELEQDQNV